MVPPNDNTQHVIESLEAINEAIARIVFLDEWHRLPDRLRATSTRLTSQLAGGLNKSAASIAPPTRQLHYSQHVPVPISRRDLVIRWLRSHGLSADAVELDGRLSALLRRLREWEDRAYIALRDNAAAISQAMQEKQVLELSDWLGYGPCEELNDVLDEASRTLSYGKQLAQALKEIAASDRSSEAEIDQEVKATSGFFSAAELAKRHSLSDSELAALRQRLKRWRKKNKEWLKRDDAGNNEDQYVYRESSVIDVIRGYQVSTRPPDVPQE